MSLLSREIAAAVDSAPASGPFPYEVAAGSDTPAGPARVTLSIQANGPVGLAFDTLQFELTDADRDVPALQAWGDRLAKRVTYLMEPLVVLEVDNVGGEVELRSLSPTSRASKRTYYEVRLSRPGRLNLRRVAFDENTRVRSTVPCQLTREVLERLVDDMSASA